MRRCAEVSGMGAGARWYLALARLERGLPVLIDRRHRVRLVRGCLVCEPSEEGTRGERINPRPVWKIRNELSCLRNASATGIGMGPKKEETPEERRRRLESEKRVRERKEAGLTPDIRDVSPEEYTDSKGGWRDFQGYPGDPPKKGE